MNEMINVLDKGYVRIVDVMGDDTNVVNAARASYDKATDQMTEKDVKLLKFLAREGHMSPFRHATMTFEVYAPLMVTRQWEKYIVGSDHTMDGRNESCLPASETVKAWTGKEYTIERLLELKKIGKLPHVRSVNDKGELVRRKVLDVWETGVSDVYEVESELGFKVKTTENHRYLTKDGYKMLKELKPGDEVMMNGIPAYKDRDWLEREYVLLGKSQKEIAEEVGCSYHTIRKWIRVHGLQQDQIERLQNHNKKHGVFGKGLTNETSDIIKMRSLKMSESSKGVPRPRKLSPTTNEHSSRWQARKLYKKEKCLFCDETEQKNLEIHHVDGNPLNNSEDNIEVLCLKHHPMRHGYAVKMVAHPVKIKNIRKVSTETVYDIEVDENHNFVSNQFVLHNSRRYITEEPTFYVPTPEEWRKKPENSKQGSGGNFTPEKLGYAYTSELERFYQHAETLYERALGIGIAPEQARLFLPAYGMYVRWRWTASLQSVAHFLNQRMAHDSQYEIQEYARAVYKLVKPRFPESINALIKEEN